MSDEARRTRTEFLAAETGTIRKDWWGKISVGLIYPNNYHVGMSNLGFQTVYRVTNDLDDVVCERIFLPEKNGRSKGPLRSLESSRPLADFDIIAFSISFENDYSNLLTVLAGAGFPLRSSERTTPHPLIIAGGATSFLNPEPIAPFVDCFLIGEAEAILPKFFRVYRKHSETEGLLEVLARNVPGAYVPSLYRISYNPDGTIAEFSPKGDFPAKVSRAVSEDLSLHDTCTTVVTPHTTFEKTYLIEAARGCPHGCRFCAAGFVYRPPRFRSRTQLEGCLDKARVCAGKVGLLASAVSDIPDLEGFFRKAADHNLEVSLSSLRADRVTLELLTLLRKTGVRTVTIAPDAGSERMRRVINKDVSETSILTAAEMLVAAGIPNLKLYFMIGLPEETMSDVEAIIDLCKRIKHWFLKASRKTARLGQITVSLSCLVPKPFTPFQWVPFEDVRALKAKIKHVKDALRRIANVKLHADLPKWAYVQALLSRGDRRVAELLEGVHTNKGNWTKTLKDSIINADFYVYRSRTFDETFPWDFIDNGIKKEFLVEEYKKALEGKLSPPCQVGQCKACGVCK